MIFSFWWLLLVPPVAAGAAELTAFTHVTVIPMDGERVIEDQTVLVEGDKTVRVPVREITPTDATGAGDQFAAGLLYGIATGHPLEIAGRMGCIAAAEVIGHVGARPEADVKEMFRAEGLV